MAKTTSRNWGQQIHLPVYRAELTTNNNPSQTIKTCLACSKKTEQVVVSWEKVSVYNSLQILSPLY